MLLSRKPRVARAKPLLGTFVHLALFSRDRNDQELEDIASGCFQRVVEIQRMMSFFEADSEISAINKSPANRRVRVSNETSRVLRISQELYEESRGAFDVMQRERGSKPDARLEFHDDGLVSRTREAAVDLGGIAKGFAVDEAVKTLGICEDLSGVLNAGGDMYFFGDEAFPFSIRSPFDDGRYFKGEVVSKCAVATSVFTSSTGPVSITVRAPSCMIADALTKATFGADSDDAARMLDRYGARQFRIDSSCLASGRGEIEPC